jgi:hypothetical protein
MVDPLTLRSLQIFVNEQHPSNMGIGKPKEGFSLYGMFHAQCMSNMVRCISSGVGIFTLQHPSAVKYSANFLN